MSPHIFNSLKSISINIVAPGSRSAQYKFSAQNYRQNNPTKANQPNNTIQCQTFDQQQQQQTTLINLDQKDAQMPLLGRYGRREPSSSSGRNAQQVNGAIAQQAQQSNEPVCQSPMFGMRRQINLNRCYIMSPPMAINEASMRQSIKQSHSSPSLANSSSSSSNNNKTFNTKDSNNQQEYQDLLPQQITRQQIHYAFALMDSNSDGMIDLRDFSQMLANLGVPIDESVLSYIITTVSRRGDHRVSESEFLDWLGQFVHVTAGSDERLASASSIVQSVGVSSGEPLRRYRSGRTRFRLAGGSSGSSLVAKSNNELPENFGPTGRRRGSVGSGLALMRSLSGSSVNSSSSSSTNTGQESQANSMEENKLIQQQQQQRQQQTDDQEIKQDLRAAFCVFDLDGDGYITFEEVRAGLRLLGEAWTTAEMSRLFSTSHLTSSSSNNDLSKQRISIDDFVRLLL